MDPTSTSQIAPFTRGSVASATVNQRRWLTICGSPFITIDIPSMVHQGGHYTRSFCPEYKILQKERNNKHNTWERNSIKYINHNSTVIHHILVKVIFHGSVISWTAVALFPFPHLKCVSQNKHTNWDLFLLDVFLHSATDSFQEVSVKIQEVSS